MGVERVEVAVLVDELGRRLLPDPGHPGQVVRRIPPEGRQQRIQGREDAGAFLDAGLVVEGVVTHPPTVVEHADVGILDQLVGVAVAGDDDDGVTAVAGLGGQGGQHVVRLEPLRADHGDGEGLDHVPDHVELRRQVGRRLVATPFVVVDDVVAERAAGQVEGHRQAHRVVVPDQVEHHRGEAVHRVGGDAGGGLQGVRQGEVGPEGEGHPVEQDQWPRFPPAVDGAGVFGAGIVVWAPA